jgi:hypothetical protein
MGENILAFSDGIVHVRSAAPLNISAKNHIRPLWFVPQLLLVESKTGLMSLAM